MLTEKINKEELEFCECFYNPIALSECLFSNLDNLSEFKENLSEIRNYQRPMLSFESLLDSDNPKLTKKENFELRKGVGEIYNFGGRRYGKSLITQKVDISIDLLNGDNEWEGFSSSDAIHLQDILDCVIRGISFHPILRMYKRRFRASPKFELECKNGWLLQGVNQNVASKDSGKQWYGKHFTKIRITEASLENQASYDKRKDAISEMGAIMRCDGMTNFTKWTPAGKAFYAPENKNKILNLPQYVNSAFDEKERLDREKEFGGQESLNYRVFVGGEVVEDGISEFDITRIEPYIDNKINLKVFEIKKEAFSFFRNLIVVNRPNNAGRIFIASDIGDGAGGTEIGIFEEVENKFHYLYRIALYSLTLDEQEEIFDFLIQKLQANVIGIDCGEGIGRTLYRHLEKKYSKNNLVYYAGQEKIGIDFKKNDTGQYELKDGKPIFLEEFMSEWSVRHLKTLLYEGRILMPQDFKLEKQINSVISRTVGTRTVYACVSEDGDHVFDMMKVFSICVWLKKDFNTTPKLGNQTSGLGAMSFEVKKMNQETKNLLNEIINKKQPITCSKETYEKEIAQYLHDEYFKAEREHNKEKMKYLNTEIRRLALLFKES